MVWTAVLSSMACGAEPGTLSVLVEAEDVIIDGLEPGEGVENIRDGWRVIFERYVVVLGGIELADGAEIVEASESFAINLVDVQASGQELWELRDLPPGRWDFGYATLGAGSTTLADASVEPEDFARMQAEELSYLIVGTLSKPDGVSCPPTNLGMPPMDATPSGQNAAGDDCFANAEVSFSFGVAAETLYGPCEIDGLPGVSIPAGGSQTVAITIHGDHIFFNGFPEGGEGGSMRLSQWLADCDLDLDGDVTRAELESIRLSDLSELDHRFQLGGTPIRPLDTMWTYLVAQLGTQGHYQGEGECPVKGIILPR